MRAVIARQMREFSCRSSLRKQKPYDAATPVGKAVLLQLKRLSAGGRNK